MIYKPYDVVVVPFPFTDKRTTKKRPALVLSSYAFFNKPTDHVICAMITDARHTPWANDTDILDLSKTGLSKPSVIRLKLFTLDKRFIIRKCGTLSKKDLKGFKQTLAKTFNI